MWLNTGAMAVAEWGRVGGWRDRPMPVNVRYAGHVYTRDHHAFIRTPLAVLNVNRESMACDGFSPRTRVFEAAGAVACHITGPGNETFLEPGSEVLLVGSGAAVAAYLDELDARRATAVGRAAYRRVLAHHTYAHRAALLGRVWEDRSMPLAQEAAT
jgi:spore maturation protein CgeB